MIHQVVVTYNIQLEKQQQIKVKVQMKTKKENILRKMMMKRV